jgi:hypothetical protein
LGVNLSIMDTPTTGTAVKALRPMFAWALVGYVALHLLFAFLFWIAPTGGTFGSRARSADFVSLYTIALPLLAVLIATQIQPILAGSKVLAGIALIEYAVALLFGALTFLIGLAYAFTSIDSAGGALGAFRYMVIGAAELAILALAGYAVLRVYQSLGGRIPDVARMNRPAPPPPPQ